MSVAMLHSIWPTASAISLELQLGSLNGVNNLRSMPTAAGWDSGWLPPSRESVCSARGVSVVPWRAGGRRRGRESCVGIGAPRSVRCPSLQQGRPTSSCSCMAAVWCAV